MKKLAIVALAGLFLAGCEKCSPADANLNVSVGTSGVRSGVAVGKACGPAYVSIGTGSSYHLHW
ncbi:hypothetical protein [Jhaorihella thermophila]|uniref:Uncharacterized protein n=1 Tax=Jhaorihella thermophila TaxID=488547 RepID=A0A1H5V217_9RHOB|nr:hypothetical protein [Jhaorihella thermophila]SEF80751.1 hypothetical protein SAMN05421751_10573 [Jhaorihella thermophila]